LETINKQPNFKNINTSIVKLYITIAERTTKCSMDAKRKRTHFFILNLSIPYASIQVERSGKDMSGKSRRGCIIHTAHAVEAEKMRKRALIKARSPLKIGNGATGMYPCVS
jgi:hypothetical protein